MRKKEFHLGFQWSMIVWFFTYVIIFGCIIYRIYTQFHALFDEYNMEQSVKEYLIHMVCIMLITIGLSFLWWFLARTEKISLLREKFDYNTFAFALIEIVILVIAVFLLNPPGYGLVDDLDNIYKLSYGYSFLSGFCVNMFGFPPSNVELVMLGGRIQRFLVAFIALMAGFVILFL